MRQTISLNSQQRWRILWCLQQHRLRCYLCHVHAKAHCNVCEEAVNDEIDCGVMCAEGMLCIAMFALAMTFTLQGEIRQQKLTTWLVRRGSLLDIRCAPAILEAQGFHGARAVATCGKAKSWKQELSHRHAW